MPMFHCSSATNRILFLTLKIKQADRFRQAVLLPAFTKSDPIAGR